MADGILGIDVGGTSIKAGMVDVATGTIIGDPVEMPTPQPANVDALFEAIEELIRPWQGQYSLAGIAFPAVVRRGVVLSAVNIGVDWMYRDLGRHSREALGTPVWTLNDCDAAAYAEMLFGAGRHEGGTIVMATLGTGVGTTLIVERKLVPNVELGMLSVRGKPAGQRVASSVRMRKKLSWRKWAGDLQTFIEMVDITISPDLVIIGGGVSNEAHRFLPLLRCRPRVMPAQLRNTAGVIGAAAYAHDREQLLGGGAPRSEVIDLTERREAVEDAERPEGAISSL